MPTYEVNHSGHLLLIEQSGVVIETIPKQKVVLQIVLDGESQNKSGVDELWIQHDGKYSSEIPWNDVEVDTVAPSSVEDFRQKVVTLLSSQTNGTPYDIIIFKLTQTSTNNPVYNEIYNPAGHSSSVVRDSAGTYFMTMNFTLDENTCVVGFLGNYNASGITNSDLINIRINTVAQKIIIESGDLALGLVDDKLKDAAFIIYKF